MNHIDEGLLAAYALNAVDPVERAGIGAHLSECADCVAALADFEETAMDLSTLTYDDDVAPPREMKAAVLAAIGAPVELTTATVDENSGAAPWGVSQGPAAASASADGSAMAHDVSTAATGASPGGPRTEPSSSAPGDSDLAPVVPLASRRPRPMTWLAAAAAVVAFAVGGLVWQPWAQRTPEGVTLVLDAPDARRYTATVEGGTVTLVRSAGQGKAVLLFEGVAAAPEGKVYQAWFQADDATLTSAGLVPATAESDGGVVLSGDAASAVGVGLTLEPAGGSQQPSTDPLALIPFT